MDKNQLKTRSLVTALLFFFGFIGWQFIAHGKAEMVDFLAAVIISLAVGFGSWYVANRRLGQK